MRILTVNEWKSFINETIDFEQLNMQPMHSGSTYYAYKIIKDGINVGEIQIEFDINSKDLEISYIEIYNEFKNKSLGSETIKEIVKKFNPETLLACCVSRQSFYSFVKAFGPPTSYFNVIKQLNSFKEVDDYLPNETNFNKDGIVIGGTDSGVYVRYDF